MTPPITWRNIEAPNFGDASRNLAAAQQAFNNGLGVLDRALTAERTTNIANWEQGKINNTQAAMDLIMGAKSPKELEDIGPQLSAMRQAAGAQWDGAAIRTALDARPNTLAQRDLRELQIGDAQEERAIRPLLQRALIQAQQGNPLALEADPRVLDRHGAQISQAYTTATRQDASDRLAQETFNLSRKIADRNHEYRQTQEAATAAREKQEKTTVNTKRLEDAAANVTKDATARAKHTYETGVLANGTLDSSDGMAKGLKLLKDAGFEGESLDAAMTFMMANRTMPTFDDKGNPTAPLPVPVQAIVQAIIQNKKELTGKPGGFFGIGKVDSSSNGAKAALNALYNDSGFIADLHSAIKAKDYLDNGGDAYNYLGLPKPTDGVSNTPIFEGNPGNGSRSKTAEQFVVAHTAAAERVAKESGIPSKFILAQSGHERGWQTNGTIGDNGEVSNNMFGIKADKNWKGPSVLATTTEFIDGKEVKTQERFRAYGSVEESFADYANFLKENPRYSKALENLQLGGDAESFARDIHRAGYATDPAYSTKLIGAMRTVDRNTLALGDGEEVVRSAPTSESTASTPSSVLPKPTPPGTAASAPTSASKQITDAVSKPAGIPPELKKSMEALLQLETQQMVAGDRKGLSPEAKKIEKQLAADSGQGIKDTFSTGIGAITGLFKSQSTPKTNASRDELLASIKAAGGFAPTQEAQKKSPVIEVPNVAVGGKPAGVAPALPPSPLVTNPEKVVQSTSFVTDSAGAHVDVPPITLDPSQKWGKPTTVVEAKPSAMLKGPTNKVVVTYVEDGDTFKADGLPPCRVDLINADEVGHGDRPGQPHGAASKRALEDLILNKEVSITVVKPADTSGPKSAKNNYHRATCQVEVEGKNVSTEMIRGGNAVLYTQFVRGNATSLLNLQKEAQDKKIGRWADPDVEDPARFNHRQQRKWGGL